MLSPSDAEELVDAVCPGKCRVPFELHVLDEVRGAQLVVVFQHRPRLDDQPQLGAPRRLRVRAHVVAQPVRQRADDDLGVHRHLLGEGVGGDRRRGRLASGRGGLGEGDGAGGEERGEDGGAEQTGAPECHGSILLSQPPLDGDFGAQLQAHMDTLLREILTSRVYEVARETPLDPAPRLSRRLDNDVLLKREDLQPIFSFKIRGAYNRIARLSEAERARGVIAASAGNHAQGVAFSARRLDMRAVIVMPRTTPEIKVDAVKALGAEVVLAGDRYAEAQQHSEQLAAEQAASCSSIPSTIRW